MKKGRVFFAAKVLVFIVGTIPLITASPRAETTHSQMGIPDNADPIHQTYIPVVTGDFETMMKKDVEAKPQVMKRQMELLKRRYDLSDNPSDVKMAGGAKNVQQGVRVRLPDGMTWESWPACRRMTSEKRAFSRKGFCRCRMPNTRPAGR